VAKGILNISNYSGGLNNKTNSRDIADNQFQDLDSLSIETPGKLKVMGAASDYAGSTTGDLNAEVNLGNGLFQFNADHDIDNTNGAVVNTEMLFVNTDVTSDGVKVFNLNSGSLAYGTKTIPYGNTFSPVIYSAVDGTVRITPTSFVDTNTPKKLQYINETYNMGHSYSGADNDLTTAKNNHSIDVTKWIVLDAKPADTSDAKLKVYINGEQTANLINVYSTPMGFGLSSNISNTETSLTVTGNAYKFNLGDIIFIGSERMKVNFTPDANTITVVRGFHGTSATSHNSGAAIHIIFQDNHGKMNQLGYSNVSLNSNAYTSTAIPTESDYRGKFFVNFYAGTKDDTTGQFTQQSGQFFSSDDRGVNIFYEIVYTDGQKSNLEFKGTLTNLYASSANNIQLNAQMYGNIPQEDNVKSLKFYYNETDDIADAMRSIKYLLFEIDFRKGFRLAGSKEYKPFGLFVHSSYMNQNIYSYPTGVLGQQAKNVGTHLPLGNVTFKDKPENTRAEPYIEQDKHVVGMAGTGYKASTVANRRLYIGNVRYKDDVSGKLKIANDTILKSNINAFDTFSFNNRIDVEVNDGDDIIALEALGSKLLEFKRNHLYIINIARDIEFLEATLEYKGCEKDHHVVRGEGFIAWFNKFGFYLYDGKQVRDLLLDNKGQQRLVWSSYYHENNIIGYDPDERTIIIANKNQKIVSFDMKAFALYYRSKGFEAQDTTNFITNNAGDILWFSKYNGTNVELRKWNTSPSKLDSSNIDEIALKTKEYTFGKPSVDKKIISVYLSYKNGDGITLHGFRDDGEEEILATLDGDSEVNFKTLHIPIRKAKTEFVDKKAFDKLKGFGLRFSGSDVATDFEVNDIQIVFREKSVK
tara:strand:+ start:1371 stop:3971 length:2601 start_codon:yes stop_codon:yes gene_type:complete